jgi:predicted Zn-dependent protease
MDERELEAICLRAEACLREKRFPEAIALYRRVIAGDPGRESARLVLAWACYDSGDADEALTCLEALLERELQRPVFTGFAYDDLWKLCRERGDFPRLVGICERVSAAYPDETALRRDLARAYLAAGRAASAVPVLSRLAAAEPDDGELWTTLGEALVAAGDDPGAHAAFTQALALDGDEAASICLRAARAYEGSGAGDRAEAALVRGLVLQAGNPSLHAALGDLQVARGRFDEAAAAYEQAVVCRPDQAGLYYGRWGSALIRAGRIEPARLALRKAVTADPHNPALWFRLAATCRSLSLFAEEREALAAAARA